MREFETQLCSQRACFPCFLSYLPPRTLRLPFLLPLFLSFSSLLSGAFEQFKRLACDVGDFKMHPSFLVLLVVFRTAWVVTAAPNDGMCYNEDQVQAISSAGAPCDSEAEVSICCGFGSICLSNGLCETINSTQQSSFFTDDCTDNSWKSSTCPKICNNNRIRQVKF